ncbi:MAG TPA: polysaccharide biosynthesis C-terminal domain-containing protein [Chitinophagaceae bacterium]|nr:polysaccharide biosynthesis C-terminal domain-containing protein [Chitinophagaceae bacterium]
MHLAKLFYQSILWRGLYFISAFILNVLIARYYKAADSGVIFYLINYYALIILIVSLSLESALGFYISKNEIAISKLINFSLLWTAIVSSGIFIFFWSQNKNALLAPAGLLAFTFISGNLLSSYCTAIFYAKKDFFLPNIIFLGFNLLFIILLLSIDLLPASFINKQSFLILFFSSFLLQAVILVTILRYKYIRRYSFTLPSGIEYKKLLRYGIMAFAANILFFLLCRVDYWFVKMYCTDTELGNYIQVSKLAQIFFILPSILSSAIFPLIVSAKNEELNTRLLSVIRFLILFYCCCCLVLVLAGKWLFPFVFGETFTIMYLPYLFLIPGILSLPGLYIVTAYFSAKNRIKINITGTFIALLLVLLCDMIFIPGYGIKAAALISSLGYFVYQVYVLWVFKREQQIRFRDLLFLKASDITSVKKIFKRANI